MMNGSPVILKSKLQRVVTMSTAKEKHLALSLCVQEVIWIESLLEELEVQQESAISIYEDNQSAIAIAKNYGFQSRSKDTDIHHRFLREQVNLETSE